MSRGMMQFHVMTGCCSPHSKVLRKRFRFSSGLQGTREQEERTVLSCVRGDSGWMLGGISEKPG